MRGDDRRDAKPTLAALTGVRFLAAAQVVLFHSVSQRLEHAPPMLSSLLSAGYTGVSLFFVLSGFVLAYNYLSPGQTGLSRTKEFLAARVARVYPVYLVGVLLALPGFGLKLLRDDQPESALLSDLPVVLSALTLTQAWIPSFACQLNCPGWSLSVEAFFYAMFPLLALALASRSRRSLLTIASSCWALSVALGWGYVRGDPDGLGAAHLHSDALWLNVLKFNPLVRLPEFVIGMSAGLFFLREPDFLGRKSSLVSVCALGMILVSLIASTHLPYPVMHNGLLTVLFAVLIYSLAAGQGPLVTFLSTPVMTLLGETSYALYIVHVPLYPLFRRIGSLLGDWVVATPAFLIVYLGGAVLVSIVMLKRLEEPARKALRRRLAG
jgi:peptidoglycan/LPS O-acetylase OafA/YrhL